MSAPYSTLTIDEMSAPRSLSLLISIVASLTMLLNKVEADSLNTFPVFEKKTYSPTTLDSASCPHPLFLQPSKMNALRVQDKPRKRQAVGWRGAILVVVPSP